MKNKEEILAELQEGLSSGVLTESDIRPFVSSPQSEQVLIRNEEPEIKPDKLSAVDVMFYIAGIVLFSTVVSMISQLWGDGVPIVPMLLSNFIGMGLWSIAYYLIKSPLQNDIRKGLTNSLLLTGSLLVIVGGFIIATEVGGGFGEVSYIPAAIALAILGGLHTGFDKLIKRKLILLIGVLLAVSSFPTLIFGFLQSANAPLDLWSMILIISSGVLTYATRVVARINPDRTRIHNSFDSFAAFVALMSMYVASFGDYGVVWVGILIAAVLGIFYLSVVLQNKHLIANGSFFMVLTIITISFKYFSGFGVTFSLIVATFGLLASAATASSINKKYFKKPV